MTQPKPIFDLSVAVAEVEALANKITIIATALLSEPNRKGK